VRNFRSAKPRNRLRKTDCAWKSRKALAFYPHLANWESGEILNQALLFNTPLIVLS
jgi:alpha-mannosidase